MAIRWSDQYKLGIKIIDEQHKEFVLALIDLIDAVGESPINKDKIDSVFSRVNHYAEFHFSTEEKYFDEFGYEGAAEHKAKHAEFVTKFSKIKEQYLTKTIEASFNLADFLEDWLVDHLANMDKKYVDCFHKHGLY